MPHARPTARLLPVLVAVCVWGTADAARASCGDYLVDPHTAAAAGEHPAADAPADSPAPCRGPACRPDKHPSEPIAPPIVNIDGGERAVTDPGAAGLEREARRFPRAADDVPRAGVPERPLKPPRR